MRFLVFGSLNIDHVYRLDRMPRAGETVSAAGHEALPGGKGLNQAIALARAGQEVWFAGAVGQDGLFLRKLLEEAGVHTEHLRLLPAPSGHAVIQVDKSGQNAIIVYGGANHRITPDMIDETLSHFDSGDWLLMQNEISCGRELLARAAEKELRVALNPSPEPAQTRSWALEKTEWLICNEIEGQELSSETEPEKMPDALLKRYPRIRVVLTLGEDGAIYADQAKRLYQAAMPVDAVDATAAGDTFTGYFLSALAQGQDEERALKLAATAAAIAVSRPGAMPSIPFMEEVQSAVGN